ncbi:ras-related and estrogen-regulated growth inhibitor-like protein isoform X1 [Neofelis nebulosa]|uniref:ras-related and estrogen-regulated growth inhibitor-like protein isoform X1 n=1 Tax=Herpailurus yagouaroundi TaxID=1608482 RepID=UPI0005ABEDDE|nr:ras-related and estrogen-regulated growth inhibitor-like protein isoform X1 [Puma yagouaroundi]XP_058599527.1 ras-related and estrogen-regulated growth inhibitor-like protein isoform X1 [Neofelis nebulosa]
MNDVKLAVLGGEGTGKSALTVRFLTKRFIGEYASNFESIYSKHLYLEGKQLNLEIYDPCSQPKKAKFSLTSELHWADGFVIVYDISDRSSFAFAKALVYRIREPQTSHCKSCVLHFRAVESAVLLVGNKQDLCHVREVGWEEGQKLALDNRCQFCELSAAEQCLEVEMMFIRIIKDILTNFKLKEKRRPSGSKSMAKLINNVFGKRRKSV